VVASSVQPLLSGGDVKTKTYFAFRVDVWDGAGDNIVEHVAGVDDFETAVATYWAAVRRWPKAKVTLGATVF
jgi:hypothetical protein